MSVTDEEYKGMADSYADLLQEYDELIAGYDKLIAKCDFAWKLGVGILLSLILIPPILYILYSGWVILDLEVHFLPLTWW